MTISREAIRQMVIGYVHGHQAGLSDANDVVDQLTDAFHWQRQQFDQALAKQEELFDLTAAKMMAKIAAMEAEYTERIARLIAALEQAWRELETRRAIDALMESGRDPTKPLN